MPRTVEAARSPAQRAHKARRFFDESSVARGLLYRTSAVLMAEPDGAFLSSPSGHPVQEKRKVMQIRVGYDLT
jgi:hypothetical protein